MEPKASCGLCTQVVLFTLVSRAWTHDASNKMCFLGSSGLHLAASTLCLLSHDSRQKGQMQKRNGGKVVDERQLFHGTSANFVDAICQQNFDWRVCGLHGTSYGKGKGKSGPTGRTWLSSQGLGNPFIYLFIFCIF